MKHVPLLAAVVLAALTGCVTNPADTSPTPTPAAAAPERLAVIKDQALVDAAMREAATKPGGSAHLQMLMGLQVDGTPQLEAATLPAPSLPADLDGDRDVDLQDFAVLESWFTGPLQWTDPVLRLESARVGDTLCTSVLIENLDHWKVVGGQFFILYDTATLRLEGVAPGDHTGGTDAGGCAGAGGSDFSVEFIQSTGGRDIFYVVGSEGGFRGSSEDQTMATIQFTVTAEGDPWVCWDDVNHDPDGPPLAIRLSDFGGTAVLPCGLKDEC